MSVLESGMLSMLRLRYEWLVVRSEVLGNLKATTALVRVFMDFNLIALYHSYVT